MIAQELYQARFQKDLFNRIANTYDQVNAFSSFGISTVIRKKILTQCLKPQARPIEILDMLSGKGEMWKVLKSLHPHARLTALDFSESMDQKARKLNHSAFNGEIEIMQRDILNNLLPRQTFDLVVCGFGLKHFDADQLNTLAAEVKRILKPDGQFLFFEINRPNRVLARIGFSFYLSFGLPLMAFLLHGRVKDYQYLNLYLNNFKGGELAQLAFESCGFQINKNKHTAGMAISLSGRLKQHE